MSDTRRLEADEARHQPRSDVILPHLQERIDYERHMRDVFERRIVETLASIHKVKRADAEAAGHRPASCG